MDGLRREVRMDLRTPEALAAERAAQARQALSISYAELTAATELIVRQLTDIARKTARDEAKLIHQSLASGAVLLWEHATRSIAHLRGDDAARLNVIVEAIA